MGGQDIESGEDDEERKGKTDSNMSRNRAQEDADYDDEVRNAAEHSDDEINSAR